MTMVKLEWQLGWEEWKSPLLEPFLVDSEEETFPTVVKLRKRRVIQNRKRKRQLVEQVAESSHQEFVSVEEKQPKEFINEGVNESVQPCEQQLFVEKELKGDRTTGLEPMAVEPSIPEEGEENKSFSENTTENVVGEGTVGLDSLTVSKEATTLPPLSTNTHRHTLWQRLRNTLEKRSKQYSLKGFSPPGFVVDSLPDLKVSLSIELYDQGYTKDSRKILYPYDQHSKRLIEALDLGLIPPYEDLPTNHSFYYYQGCLIAEIRDFRSSFQGFLQTLIKSSNKNSPITYKLILRPDFHTILSDIERATIRSQYNGRVETETKIQLERFLLSVLFRNVHCDSHVPRFHCFTPLDSFKWNRIRRPRMKIQDDKGILCSWRKFCRCAGYLSPQSIVLYVCMMMESFDGRDEKSLERVSKTLEKSSTLDGRRVNHAIHHDGLLPSSGHSVLPSSLHELSWKPFRPNSNIEAHRCALYTYKRNIYLLKGTSNGDYDRSSKYSSRLRPDILRILAFSYARKNNSSTSPKQVHCSFQIVKRGNPIYYCESRRSYMRDGSMDINSFTTCSLEHAMDFADNFRRICEFEGYICILDSFRGPFEKVRDTSSESIPERTFQKRPSNIPHNPPPSFPSYPRMESAATLQLPSSSFAQAQPGVRPISSSPYYYSLSGNAATSIAYGKNFAMANPSTNLVPQNNASFYQGVQSENRKRPNPTTFHSNNPMNPSLTTSTSPTTTTTTVVRGPKPLVAQTSANRVTLQTALGVTNNDNKTHTNLLGNKKTSSPVHSSTSSFHGSNMP
ncbi:hypothetical protein GpartN1_g3388.t1 [Galdieria partita]|uniref:Spt20-like SEP domain-containing protein n=1 Tax=Galdieria partita TaxID=83374 RepID=A0A9C7PXB4_9RHOD|nr:hypothetical protein GpartN1_g3388.t1 [Galdieria partita]